MPGLPIFFLSDSKYQMQCTVGGGGNKAPNLSEVICEEAFLGFTTRVQADIFDCVLKGHFFLNNTTLSSILATHPQQKNREHKQTQWVILGFSILDPCSHTFCTSAEKLAFLYICTCTSRP